MDDFNGAEWEVATNGDLEEAFLRSLGPNGRALYDADKLDERELLSNLTRAFFATSPSEAHAFAGRVAKNVEYVTLSRLRWNDMRRRHAESYVATVILRRGER